MQYEFLERFMTARLLSDYGLTSPEFTRKNPEVLESSIMNGIYIDSYCVRPNIVCIQIILARHVYD